MRRIQERRSDLLLKGVVMRRSGVVDGFESEKQNLKINAGMDREPVEFKLENRGDVISGRASFGLRVINCSLHRLHPLFAIHRL